MYKRQIVLLEVALRLGASFLVEEPPEFSSTADEEAYRVLAVGDSWVAGAEAPEGQGFVDHLGRDLSASIGDGRAVQMVNLGRTGANSAYVALTVNEALPALRPDLVVVLVGQNNSSNFYRVAEVEELLGEDSERRWLDQLRVVKLARIALANFRGESGYRRDRPQSLPAIPALMRDNEDAPLNQLRVLAAPAGQNYLFRRLDESEQRSVDPIEQLAWELLGRAVVRDLTSAGTFAKELRSAAGLPADIGRDEAAQVQNDRDVLVRYALLRYARQERRWRDVRHHAGAFVGYEDRSLLSDLGAGWAHLLGGDWRSARAYLEAAHNRAPGFGDTVDLASQIPLQARNAAVYEALEFRFLGVPLAYEVVPVLQQTHQYDSAVQAQYAWLNSVPEDLSLRVDLAVWMATNGRRAEGDSLLGLQANTLGRLPSGLPDDVHHWSCLLYTSPSPRD